MITPEASRQKGGVTQCRYSRFLIAGIRANGKRDLCTDDLRWESGIEAAVKAAAESGIKFDPDFILLDTATLASTAGRYCLVEPSPGNSTFVRISFPTPESAKKYLEHYLPQEEVIIYIDHVAKEFLREFSKQQVPNS